MRKIKKMKAKYLIPYNRYGDKNYFVKVQNNLYKLEMGTDLPYRVIGDISNVEQFAIDPSGGPFISIGFTCDDFIINDIVKVNNNILFELILPNKIKVKDIAEIFDNITICEETIKEEQETKKNLLKSLDDILKENTQFVLMIRQSLYNKLPDDVRKEIEDDEKEISETSWASIDDNGSYLHGNSISYKMKQINPLKDDTLKITGYCYSNDKKSIKFFTRFDSESQHIGAGYYSFIPRETDFISIKEINKILK